MTRVSFSGHSTTRRLASGLARIAGYVCVLASLLAAPADSLRAQDAATRRSAVQEQFARAEGLRAALEAKPERQRSLQEYAQTAAAYRRVYLITPHAVEVPLAIKQVADLYNRMGEQFDPKYFRQALASYEFLVRDYPSSRDVQEAKLAIAALQRGPLDQPELAKKSYEEFLEKHPRSARAAEARSALAEMAAAAKRPAAAAADCNRAAG